ncbi:MAG: hypothetical protein R8M38_00685, partial [Mariprofundaceae bacterium]
MTAVFALICISEGAKKETLEQIEQLGIRNIIIQEKKLSVEQKSKAIESLSPGLNLNDVNLIKRNLPHGEIISAIKKVETHSV